MAKPISGTGYGTDDKGRIVYYENGKIKRMGTEAFRFLKRGALGIKKASDIALEPYRRNKAESLAIAKSGLKHFQKTKQSIGDRLVYESGTTQTIRQRKIEEKAAEALMIADENAVLKAQVEMDKYNKTTLDKLKKEERGKTIQQLEAQLLQNKAKGKDTTDDEIVVKAINNDRDHVQPGLSEEEQANLKAKADKARSEGKLSDLRGGGGNVEELKIKSDVHTIDPETGEAVGVLTRSQRKAFEARDDVRRELLKIQKSGEGLRTYKEGGPQYGG